MIRDLAESRAAILAERARRSGSNSFASFVKQAWGYVPSVDPLVWGWHMDALCLHLEAVAHGRLTRLVINIPPGHAKSVIVSVLFPAWVWTWWPRCQFLAGSCDETLAVRDSTRCRAVIESPWYVETHSAPAGWTLRHDQNTKGHFVTTLGGERFATGIGATGRRAHILLIDDPLEQVDAYSKPKRERVNTWISQTLSQRFVDASTGRTVLIMQRLHEEDPSGYLLASGKWQHLRLPSLYEVAEPCATFARDEGGELAELWRDPREEEGEALFPEKFPLAVLDAMRGPDQLGADGFSAQHQQRPTPATGGMFRRDWWRFWKPDGVVAEVLGARPRHAYEGPAEPLPAVFDSITISVDANFKAKADARSKQGPDPVSILVGGARGARRYVLERQSGPYGFTRTVEVLVDVWQRWRMRCWKVLIETKANGDAILETLRPSIPGVVGVEPKGGKEARAWSCQPQVQAGQVYLPDGAPWIEEWISQFASFPRGKHDDDVDALSQWLIDLAQSGAYASQLGQVQIGTLPR